MTECFLIWSVPRRGDAPGPRRGRRPAADLSRARCPSERWPIACAPWGSVPTSWWGSASRARGDGRRRAGHSQGRGLHASGPRPSTGPPRLSPERCAARLLVTAGCFADGLPRGAWRLITLDAESQRSDPEPLGSDGSRSRPGTRLRHLHVRIDRPPKGVQITHGGLLNLCAGTSAPLRSRPGTERRR